MLVLLLIALGIIVSSSSYHHQELKPQEDTHIRQILRQQRLHTFIGCEQTTRTILVIYSAFESYTFRAFFEYIFSGYILNEFGVTSP